MRSPVRTAATMSIMAGVLAACTTTTTGTLAQTTEPGPPLTSSRPTSSPSRSTSSAPPTVTAFPTLPDGPMLVPYQPTVPAPANWSTMTCQDFTKLDEATQLSVVDAIQATKGEALHTDSLVRAFRTLADAICQLRPTTTVRDVLTGDGPP